MWATLDLDWRPTSAAPTPPAGRAAAIIRGDTFVHVFTFTNEDATPFVIDGTVAAQIRPARLSDSTAGSPTASFTTAIGGVDGNEVTISLTAAETLALPSTANDALFWDLQQTVSGVVTTLLTGKVRVLDDVTRVA